eukprot:Gb_09941 [translate_table: standard]
MIVDSSLPCAIVLSVKFIQKNCNFLFYNAVITHSGGLSVLTQKNKTIVGQLWLAIIFCVTGVVKFRFSSRIDSGHHLYVFNSVTKISALL